MPKISKYLALIVVILFVLACNAVTQPIQDVQELAGTAQSFATALPLETLQSVVTQIPVETFQALPSMAPTVEAFASSMPDFGSYFNPEGTPVTEWNGIPIMPQATAGEEFSDTNTYSFKVNASVQEAEDFYNAELARLGWSSSFNMPGNDEVAVHLFQKEDSLLTVMVTDVNGSVVVVLTLT